MHLPAARVSAWLLELQHVGRRTVGAGQSDSTALQRLPTALELRLAGGTSLRAVAVPRGFAREGTLQGSNPQV